MSGAMIAVGDTVTPLIGPHKDKLAKVKAVNTYTGKHLWITVEFEGGVQAVYLDDEVRG
jgi:hypothetical protein